MYAVIKTGGKQYRVQEGDVLKVELLPGEKGSTITFNEVLMIGGTDQPKVGRPVIEGAKVEAQIVDPLKKGPKALHFVKNYFGFTRRQGHRQKYTEIKVTGIRA
ncbi:MAG: 50S ribosomal protein L21 [Deltaproteobacteria bacterium]|nr:50S ribosomal protein L21 [Deltaproteobacteria bacterium]